MKKLLTILFVLSASLAFGQTNVFQWIKLKSPDTTTHTLAEGEFRYNPTVHKFSFNENGTILHFGTGSGSSVWGGLTGTITDQSDLVTYVADQITDAGLIVGNGLTDNAGTLELGGDLTADIENDGLGTWGWGLENMTFWYANSANGELSVEGDATTGGVFGNSAGSNAAQFSVTQDSIQFTHGVQITFLTGGGPIDFYPGGLVKRFSLEEDADIVVNTNQVSIDATSQMTFNYSTFIVKPITAAQPLLDLRSNATASSMIKVYEDTDNGSNYETIAAPASLAANYAFVLPADDGNNLDVLQTNGSGTLTWVAQSAGFSNPMTTRGDLMTMNSSPAAARIAIGSANKFLKSDGTDPSWAFVPYNGVDFLDTDGTLAANSDSKVATQKAVKTYVTSVALPAADATHDGYLSSTNWTQFNAALSSTLTSAKVFVGNGSNVATGVTMSGDATIDNAGALTIGSQKVGISKMTMSTARLLGRTTASTGAAEEITVSTGLTMASTALTNNLSVGVSGGQTLIGGTGSGDNLTISTTSNGTKGKILFGASAYDEVNDRIGISQTTPVSKLDVTTNNLTTTTTMASGISVNNNQPATSGVTAQYSPPVTFHGRRWTSSTDKSSDFRIYNEAVASAVDILKFQYSDNGGAYSTILSLFFNGTLTTPSAFNALNATFTSTAVTAIQMAAASGMNFNGAGSINYNGLNTANATGQFSINGNGTIAATTGTLQAELGVGSTFAPASGAVDYTSQIMKAVINQTSTASGNSYIFNVKPTYTSAKGNVVGINYDPTVTAITGTHYAIKSTSGSVLMTQGVLTAQWVPMVTYNLGAHTGMTASTAFPNINVPTVTQKWVDGTVADQTSVYLQAPTWDGTTTLATFTVASNLKVDAPVAGAKASFGSNYAIWSNGDFKANNITMTGTIASTAAMAISSGSGAMTITGHLGDAILQVDYGVSSGDVRVRSVTPPIDTNAKDIFIYTGTVSGTGVNGSLNVQSNASGKMGFWNTTAITQPTTGISAASFTANTSLIANDTATFDGYTIGQIVKALRNLGLLQ